MPFVVPPSTRGKKPEKPLWKIALTRFGDTIAGRGLENFRIEYDLKQEAEESISMTPSSRGSGSSRNSRPSSASNNNNENNDKNDDNNNLLTDNNNNNSTTRTSTTTIVTITPENNTTNNPENNDTICCLPPPVEDEEQVVINKYGAHFVWVPTLKRYIARADRKTVRASTIVSRLCFITQVTLALIALYLLMFRSVDCLGATRDVDSIQQLPGGRPNQPQKSPSSPSSPPASTVSTSNRTFRPVTTIYPGWHHITQERSGLYVFFFFILIIFGHIFQFLLMQNGDKDLGNPGFLSIEGDDQVQFELKGEFQNAVVDCTIPQELRKACKTCGGPQPLRCRHCKSCGRCSSGRQDHHCFFLGHCIGSYDYGSFILCIFMMALMCAIGLDLIFGSWVNVWSENCGVPGSPDAGYFSRQWHANALTFVYIILGLFANLALWLLFGTHVALTSVELTTYEFARPGKNPHLRYYPAVPQHSSSKLSSMKRSSSFSMTSPFSESWWYRNFINLWWHYGTRSMYNRFGVGSRWHISALPTVRGGSIDGVNYFVAGSTSRSLQDRDGIEEDADTV